jgi:farnesyl diphosphate synthase
MKSPHGVCLHETAAGAQHSLAETNAVLPPVMAEYRERIDGVLDRVLPSVAADATGLRAAMRHAVRAGGKRLRPALVYATGRALGASLDALDAPAAAVEIIHTYSLVHDDLPAMDNDSLRRGQPTCHIVYGEAMAILAGDTLQVFAMELLARECDGALPIERRMAMLRILCAACGAEGGLASGQAMDIASVGKALTADELESMHAQKTGALFSAAVQMGAIAAGCEDEGLLGRLHRYGYCLGLAFQVRDDILDVEGNARLIGKTAGKDERACKPTYPALLGLDASRALLDALVDEAVAQIGSLGSSGGDLAALVRFAASRSH